jgi:MoxR-like ATPase
MNETIKLNWKSPEQQWELVAMCVNNAFTTFIEGAPGLGKTYIGLNSRVGETPVYQITFNPDQAVQELQGTYIPTESGAWVWRDGPILQAFRSGGLLILNEMGRASDAVLDFLIAITDSKESAYITLMNGETVARNPNLRIVATSNSSFNKLPEALQDRFEARLKVTAPNPQIIDELNRQSPGLGSMVSRSYAREDKVPAITSREAFAYLRLTKSIGSEAAAQAVWGNNAPQIAQEVLLAQELTVK